MSEGYRLLRQPHGFEGLLLRAEDLDADNPALARRVHECGLVLHRAAADLPPPRLPSTDEHEVLCIPLACRLEGVLVPCLKPFRRSSQHAVVAMVLACVRLVGPHADDDV